MTDYNYLFCCGNLKIKPEVRNLPLINKSGGNMIMLVSVTCSSGYLAKIHNDRDNLGWKEENKQIYFFLSHICNMNLQ